MDFHRNIFYYYRGQRTKEGSLVRQIEDNTTKALINTVEHLSEQSRREFLEMLGIEHPSEDVYFALQTHSVKRDAERWNQKLLLFILRGDESLDQLTSQQLTSQQLTFVRAYVSLGRSRGSQIAAYDAAYGNRGGTDATRRSSASKLLKKAHIKAAIDALELDAARVKATDRTLEIAKASADDESTSRPDAWIYGDNYGVLIESKLTTTMNEKQAARHRRILGEPHKECKITWDRLHGFFKSQDLNDQKDQFLVDQFVQYLEYTGLVDMVTLTHQHFDCLWNPDDAEGKRWIQLTMRGIAKALTRKLGRLDLNTAPGNLSTTSEGYYAGWVTLIHKDGRKSSSEPHITIELLPYEFQIFANVETKTVLESIRRLESQPAVALEALQELEGYYLLVNDKRPIAPLKFQYVKTFQVLCGSKMTDADIKFTADILKRLTYKGTNPQLSVRKSYQRHHVVNAGLGFVDELVEAYKQLLPIVELMREK